MALLVVAYPRLSTADLAWIQAIRERHDPYYSLVAPHFTLVFPVDTVAHDTFVTHITTQARLASRIPFTIRCAMIVKDTFIPLTHLFLVPDDGNSALIKLHDALYTHILADALRLDVPFIPHITIGAHADARECKAVADDINRQNIQIRGQVETLDIVAYENTSITPIRCIALAQCAK